MNRPLQRAEIEQFAGLLAEKRRRQAKKLHTTRGHRDKAGVWRGGLLEFVRYFWHILEPSQPLVTGWAMEAIVEHLEAITFGEITNLLINVPPGFCKALDHDTPILTTWGWKKHGDLVVGDFVFGPDGRPKRVLGCTPDRVEESFAVRFDDGAEIVASGGHLWEIERDVASVKPRYRRGRKAMVVSTSDLRVSGYKHQSNYEKRPDRIKISEPINLPPKRLMIDPYVLGAWLGDGSQDAEHFSRLGRIAHIHPPIPPRKSAFYHIAIEGLRVRLRLMGLIGNKHIPEDYLEGSIEQRWELLRGLMDTDGTCAKNGSCSFVNKNVAIADGFMALCRSLGLKAWKTETWSKTNGVTFGPYQFINFIPPVGAVIFKLARKQARVRGNMNDRSRNRYVDAVTSVGPRRVKCIQVEGNLYLAGKELVTTHNSLLTDVFYPAWEWGPQNLAHMRYVAFSYSSSLTERDNAKFKDLITSSEYQAMYGTIVNVRKTGETKVSNWKHGWKLASSVGGVGTGERGNRAILDDPHNVKESESKAVREETIRWFRESLSSRLNNMETDAKIVIMQRVNEQDVSGEIITEMDGWCHLLIPMEYVWQADENGEPFATDIGWIDPRWTPNIKDCEGALAWEERFPARIIPGMKKDVGPFGWHAQYQQTPEVRGGAIFEREWWQPWEPADGKFPVFSYIVASTDSAFGQKENADPSACVVAGIFENENGFNRVMVIEAWRRNLKFSGPKLTPQSGERGMAFLERQRKSWGLVEWLADTCTRRKVDRLLIENKASGISASQSLANSHPYAGWAVQLVEPKGDKWARAQSVQPTFSAEMVYIPWPLRQWGADLVDEMAIFPKGKYDDLTDAMTQCIKHLRDIGLLRNDSEIRQQLVEAAKPKGRPKKLYPGTAGKAA